MTEQTCDSCNEQTAVVQVVLATMSGAVLDSSNLCADCAEVVEFPTVAKLLLAARKPKVTA